MVSKTPTILRLILIFTIDNQKDNGLSPHLIHYLFLLLIISINNNDIEIKTIDSTPVNNKYFETKKYTTTDPTKAIKNSLSIFFK